MDEQAVGVLDGSACAQEALPWAATDAVAPLTVATVVRSRGGW